MLYYEMWCSLFSDLAFTLGDCRGFAYITIESTADNWKKCTIKLFHAFHQIIKNISLIQFVICNVKFLSIIIKACPFLMVQNGKE